MLRQPTKLNFFVIKRIIKTRKLHVDIPRKTGPKNTTPAYTFGDPKKPGIIVLQEWWGVNEQIKITAQRFALAGFRTLLIDFYRGKIASSTNEAQHLFDSLDWQDAKIDVQAGIDYLLKEGSPKVGCTGFCMGGALTLSALSQTQGLSAGAVFYGIPPPAVFDTTKIKAPLIGHWAELDGWCSPEKVKQLSDDLTRANVMHHFYSYSGVDHAFCNEKRPEVFNKDAAQTAFDRTFTFFGSTLL